MASRLVEAMRVRVQGSYGKLPLAFEKNAGQFDERARFVARSRGGSVFVTATGSRFALEGELARARLARRAGMPPASVPPTRHEGATFEMNVVGGNPQAEISGLEELPGKANYLLGSDPAKWHIGMPTYAKVVVRDVYPGVDLVYYGNQGQLEYDFVVGAEADPDVIRVAFGGADRLDVNGDGDLVLKIGEREVVQRRPVVYQRDGSGRRRPLGAAYVVLDGGQVAFRVDGRDRSIPVIIDPVLVFSTYLGGSQGDTGHGIAVDGQGSAYVIGTTGSTDFPTASPYQATPGGPPYDAFVAKLNPAGNALVYSTYVGGAGDDEGVAIAVDGAGNAYLTGWTTSADFPTVNPIQAALPGSHGVPFVAKLNGVGNALVYSTYLGGTGNPAFVDGAAGIAVDGSGAAYVTGVTASTDFPTAHPFQPSLGAAPGSNAFVSKLDPAGSALVYSTYLGGSGVDAGTGIAVDGAGNAYVTGSASSTNFPTVNPLQASLRGSSDAFAAKLDAAGALVYSTYLGGSGSEEGFGIAVDRSGNAYLTGRTASSDFPTAAPLQASLGGSSDAFVAKLDAAGSALSYSTYLGGSSGDAGRAIAVDGSGNAYVTGQTQSSDFPTVKPLQASFGGSGSALVNVFVAKLNSAGSALVYSTYLGGAQADVGNAIAVDGVRSAYVTGFATSSAFPQMHPLQPAYGGAQDAFVAKIACSSFGAGPGGLLSLALALLAVRRCRPVG